MTALCNILGSTLIELYVEEPSDPSVGIPSASGQINTHIPDWLIAEEQLADFEQELAGFVNSWLPDGVIMTQKEAKKRELEGY